jgi:hypothetical protein
MATITPTWKVWELPNNADVYGGGASNTRIQPAWHLVTIKWNDADGGDTCTEVPAGYLTDLSVQISGTTVTSVAIHGSNDGVEYYVLNDPQGVALTGIDAEKIEQILERTVFIRPVVTTGTDVDIVLCGRIPHV